MRWDERLFEGETDIEVVPAPGTYGWQAWAAVHTGGRGPITTHARSDGDGTLIKPLNTHIGHWLVQYLGGRPGDAIRLCDFATR